MAKQDLHSFLRTMGKNGFPEVLAYVEEQGPMYYNDILKFALKEKLVKSRASIPALVNGLYKFELVEREELAHMRPMRTRYTISKKGRAILTYLRQIESELN